jgi:hypothetical protein
VLVAGLGLLGWSLSAFQNPFRRYVPWEDYANYPVPEDWSQPGETIANSHGATGSRDCAPGHFAYFLQDSRSSASR